jgi:hypothetical protein
MRSTIARLVGVIAVVSCIVWLVMEPSSRRVRINRLNAALRDGTIGVAPVVDVTRLRAELQWLAPHASITMPIVVNEPYTPGRFHIYTTTEAAKALTRCDRGNAVYDAELDVVFVDETLVRIDDFRAIYEASAASGVLSMSELPFFTVFQRFVLLHELGHRHLHRASGRVFDTVGTRSTTEGLRREREADAFALARLTAAYTADAAAGFRHTADTAAEVLDLSLARDAPATERVAVDLTGMVASMSIFNLFISTPYGPFYRDRTHPPFLARAQNALGGLRHVPLPPPVHARVLFFSAALVRQASTAGAAAAEVLLPEPIDDVLLTEGGLWIATAGYRHVYAVEAQDLVRSNPDAPSTLRLARDAAIVTAPQAIERWWMSAPGTIEAWNGSTVLRFDGRAWVPTARADGATFVTPLQGSTPAQAAVLRATIADVGYYLVATPSGVASVAEHDVLRAIRNAIPAADIDIDFKAFSAAQDLVFAIHRDDTLWGVASVRLPSLTVRVTPLVLPSLPVTSARQLAVLPTPAGLRLFVVGMRADAAVLRWEAWEVGAGPARRVGHHDLLRASVENPASTFLGTFAPSLLGVSAIAADTLLIEFETDSVYVLDVARHRARVAFHPGDSSLVLRSDGHGRVAVIVKGGHKVIVLDVT